MKSIKFFTIGIFAIIFLLIMFKKNETYTTREYTRDKESGCIIFKDEIGIKHVVCNNYTITEY